MLQRDFFNRPDSKLYSHNRTVDIVTKLTLCFLYVKSLIVELLSPVKKRPKEKNTPPDDIGEKIPIWSDKNFRSIQDS